MKLRELKKYVDEASKKAETTDPDVIFWFGRYELEIAEVRQFGVVPDVSIFMKKVD